jgi:HK97 gp10 family phage protein
MSAIVTVKIKGLNELHRALLQLPIEVQGNPLRAAVAAGARLIQKEAIDQAEKYHDTGTLEKNIVIMRSRRRSIGRSEYAVGVKRVKRAYANTAKNRRAGRVGKKYSAEGDAFYWRFLEFGTSKMPKKPFLVPAFESKKMASIEVIKTKLASAIFKAASKLKVKP